MNFEFSDSEWMMLNTARQFLKEKASLDAKISTEAGEEGVCKDVWKAMAEMGWLEVIAGRDSDEIHILGILAQELGRSSLASPYIRNAAATVALHRAGLLNDRRFERLSCGGMTLSIARVNAIKDVVVNTRADGCIQIESGSALVEWAHLADEIVLPLMMGEQSLVLCIPRTALGVTIKSVETFDSSRAAIVSFNGMMLDACCAAWTDKATLDEALALGDILGAAEAVGGAEGALELTVEYVKERNQFGHSISEFQAVRHGLADVKIYSDAAWLAAWQALGKAAEGESIVNVSALAMSAAKRAIQMAALKGSQYHGGMGHTVDSHMQFYYRRAGTYHARCDSEWELLGALADSYVSPIIYDSREDA